jgi:hypothetical protein
MSSTVEKSSSGLRSTRALRGEGRQVGRADLAQGTLAGPPMGRPDGVDDHGFRHL